MVGRIQRQVPPPDSANGKSKKHKGIKNISIDGVLGDIDKAIEEAKEEKEKQERKTQKTGGCCGGCCY